MSGLYESIGYHMPKRNLRMTETAATSWRIREDVIRDAVAAGRGSVTVLHTASRRAMLLVDGHIKVSILLCPTRRTPAGNIRWVMTPTPKESKYVTLLCRLDTENDGVHSFFVFPKIRWTIRHKLLANDPWLAEGIALRDLSEVRRAAYLCGLGVVPYDRVDEVGSCDGSPKGDSERFAAAPQWQPTLAGSDRRRDRLVVQ
jgi:hypothetical protein